MIKVKDHNGQEFDMTASLNDSGQGVSGFGRMWSQFWQSLVYFWKSESSERSKIQNFMDILWMRLTYLKKLAVNLANYRVLQKLFSCDIPYFKKPVPITVLPIFFTSFDHKLYSECFCIIFYWFQKNKSQKNGFLLLFIPRFI